jgi:hypothetical protein
MPLPAGRGGAPWTGGAVQILIAALAAAPVLYFFGAERWPFFVGAFVVAVLALGALERLWQSRPLPRLPRAAGRRRFRVFSGGKDKGNGHAHDVPGDDDPGAPGDKPRWLM